MFSFQKKKKKPVTKLLQMYFIFAFALPPEVVHLLLCPELDNLPWVVLVALVEAVVILDVATPMLELIECRLVYLDGTLRGHLLIFTTTYTTKQIKQY